jgi:hypothetical protein
MRHPLCVHCLRRGVVKAAEEVDHVVALVNGGPDTDDNLQSLCVACHQVKTRTDLGVKVRPAIGLDGWPVDGGQPSPRVQQEGQPSEGDGWGVEDLR